jgi:hypothetical protein
MSDYKRVPASKVIEGIWIGKVKWDELQSKLHRAQCEVNELQNTLKLERELKERYQCALREIVPYGDLTMHASKDFIWKSLKAAQRLAREALR